MANDDALTARIRGQLKRRRNVTERTMFGGVAFMVNGNMVCGVVDDSLCLRLGADGAADALRGKHVDEMDFTGRPLKTMVFIRPAGIGRDAQLKAWIDRALTFVKTLPRK